ncbi:DUF4376 domain-containing protein [Sphingomonas pituitosa]|uniref:DUF4376 domain-containing protein n=1 Tax=Sphingomonas pituitosa TaxID=99597 RepID=UPI00082EB5E4|nr:DUF4376 domain-containing protein [Sphingomonas pituitosa]
MFILEHEMPNGALAKYHRADSFMGMQGGTQVLVDSYAKEDMVLIVWRGTYTLPPEVRIGSLADAEAALTATGRPFAGAALIDAATGDLDLAKVRAWAAAKAARDGCAGGGCQTPLGRVDSDERSRVLIAGAVQMAQIALAGGEPYSVDWVMADNQPRAHDALAMIALGVAVGEHIASCWQRAQALRAEIDAAETVEDLAALDIISGWPGAAA